MKLALSTDHAGFEAVQHLKSFLESQGYECVYFGPESYDPDDDYPDYIKPAAEAVASGECAAGIIFGGSGQGEAMAANRVKGVRCGVYYGPVDNTEDVLVLNRQHNDANMLSLGARFLDQPSIESAVTTWLHTPFSKEERHIRRIGKLDA